jgi:hypothetical protein
MGNPYPRNPKKWAAVTDRLLEAFPIPMKDMAGIVRASWADIFHSRVGSKGYRIGLDILPEPQIMGFLLHELIPLNLAAAYPGQWRRGGSATECDVVSVQEIEYSFEIKTSSSATGIFGNRSYAHVSESANKRRGSFYLAVNFGKFSASERPEIELIRFGWLGAADWIGQRAKSGQQAHLTGEAKAYKLRIIYERLVK